MLLTEDQLVEVWSGIERQVETLLNDEEGLTGEPPCPFDGASDVPMEEQKCGESVYCKFIVYYTYDSIYM